MYLPGRNPTIEALSSTFVVKKLYLQEAIHEDEKIKTILILARQRHIPITSVDRKRLEKMSNTDPHQGVVAELEIIPKNLTESYLIEHPGFYIYIREAQYEHNIGAIIRTAEAAGLQGVIIPPRVQITSTIARISMGAIFHIPIFQASLFPTLKLFKELGLVITGIELSGKKPIYESHLADNGLLIVGGEDKSLSSEVADKCDQLLYIPQFGKVNSLNMSVAAALAIYEHVRQTKL